MTAQNPARFNAPKTSEPLIRRHDHHHFHGWVVTIVRGDLKLQQYFSDKPHGRAASLRAARTWRDTQLDRLPLPVKLKRTFIRNTTGIIGVTLVRDVNKKGKVLERFAASIPLAAGGHQKRSFAIGKYGRREALRLAIEARDRGVAKFLADRRRGVTISRRRRPTAN